MIKLGSELRFKVQGRKWLLRLRKVPNLASFQAKIVKGYLDWILSSKKVSEEFHRLLR